MNLDFRSMGSDEFYSQLTTRNRHFISLPTQGQLKGLRVFIAGCGAAGGACIEPLARLGVTQFRLSDNGTYELSNLNRQHTFIDQVGVNKSSFHAQEVSRINPFADVVAFPEGVTRENLDTLIEWADLVIDAVDVTVQESIQLKFHLHEVAKKARRPVLSPLDPGFCQMGYVFDYRKSSVQPIGGRLEACKKTKNPIQGLLTMFPIEAMPSHSLQLFVDLLESPEIPASQLGCSADLLSGIIAAIVLKFAATRELPWGWNMDLASYALTFGDRFELGLNGFFLRRHINRLLKKMNKAEIFVEANS